MDTSQNNNSHDLEEAPSRTILFKYLPYWPLFIIFAIVCVGIAYLYLWYATPTYQATASIIIKDQKKGSDDSKEEASLKLINDSKIIENEIEVIKSRTIMENVVEKLHLYAPVFKDLKIKSVSAYISSPLTVEHSTPDSIIENPKIYMNYNKAKGTVSVKALLDSVSYTCRINEWSKTPYGTLRFLPNPQYVEDSLKYPLYFSLIKPRNAALAMAGSLTPVQSDRLSSVIDLTYVDEVPRKAEDVLNALLDTYTQTALDEKSTLARNTLAFVEARLGIVSHELDSIENRIKQYRSGAGAVNLSSQGVQLIQTLGANDQKVSDINTQLSALDEVEKSVRSNSAGIVPSSVGITDPTLTQLTNNLYTNQLEYERLKKNVGQNNPLLVSLEDQINKIKPDILNNIQSTRRNLQATKQSLQSTSGGVNSILQTIPAKEKELIEISRAQTIKSSIYQFLLQKKEESILSYNNTDPNSRIIDRAQTQPTPVSPPKAMYIYLASVFLAFLLTIGLVTAKDFLNGKVLYRYELEKLTSFPVIGEIAYKRTKSPIVIEAGKRTFIAEEFRKIRVALSFLGIGENLKKIMLTSSIPGEGKSFIALNLAVSLALTGKKVVLVDLDLNNPVLGKKLDIDDSPGLSNYLTGEKEPEEIIRRVGVHENLFFVPAGSLPDSPSELLSNGRVKDILFYLQNVFDFVIIDTAPVFAVSDTHMLSEYCDATLYVVRHNYTPKKIIKRISVNNKINPLTNPAIIFNGLKARGFSRKTTNGYGYDYLYEYKQKKSGKSKRKSKVKTEI